jgi:hypothetical protein
MALKLKKVFILMLTVVFSLTALIPAYAQSSDTEGHWASSVISKWMDNGVITGYNDGTFKPENYITRAEFVTILDRIFKYQEKTDEKFSDVPKNAWFADAVEKAFAAGVTSGDGTGKFNPYANISRQEAAVMIARAFGLKAANSNAANSFADASAIASWAKSSVSALFEEKYMSGRPDNEFAPTDSLNRAEAVKIIDNIITEIKNAEGVYSGDISGNVVVNTAGVTLKDMSISGALYLTQGIGEGEVILDGIAVSGKLIVLGGGENSVILNNSSVGETLVVIKQNGKIRIVAKGSTDIPRVEVGSGAVIQEDGVTGKGFGTIGVLEVKPGESLQLDGDFEEVIVKAKSDVTLAGGTVGKVEIAEDAADAKLTVAGATVDNIDVKANAAVGILKGTVTELVVGQQVSNTSIEVAKDAAVTTLTANGAANVTGTGTIKNAIINASGVTIEPKPESITVSSGVTANVGGETTTGTDTPSSGGGGGGGGGSTQQSITASKIEMYFAGKDTPKVGSISGNRADFILDSYDSTDRITAIKITTSPSDAKLNVSTVTGENGLEVTVNKTNLTPSSITVASLLGSNEDVSLGTLMAAFGDGVTVKGTLTRNGYKTTNVTLYINFELVGGSARIPNPYVDIEVDGINITATIINNVPLAEIGIATFLEATVGELPQSVSITNDETAVWINRSEYANDAAYYAAVKDAIKSAVGMADWGEIMLSDLVGKNIWCKKAEDSSNAYAIEVVQ